MLIIGNNKVMDGLILWSSVYDQKAREYQKFLEVHYGNSTHFDQWYLGWLALWAWYSLGEWQDKTEERANMLSLLGGQNKEQV